MDSTLKLFNYKVDVITKIIENQNILKALTNNTPDFIDAELPINFHGDELIYQQIFPYLPVTTRFAEAKSYITVSFGKTTSSGSDYIEGSIVITVLCPIVDSILRTSYGHRHAYIANEIDNMMFKSRGFGLGKINSKSLEEIPIGSNSEFLCVVMRYYLTDFAK